jgi:uncharacterized protein
VSGSRAGARAGNDILLRVRLTPRAGRDGIDGLDEAGVLRVRVAAAPVEGAANRALLALLARTLGIAPSHVHLDAGSRGRLKRVRVSAASGVRADDVEGRWPGATRAG